MRRILMAAALAVASFAAPAEVTVGVIVGATGPGATIGIPTKSTFGVRPREAGGEKVRYVILDDATDPTNAVRNARKLVTEEKVDVIMGSTMPSDLPFVHETVVLRRYAQYQDACAGEHAFHKRYMTLPFPVPDEKFAMAVVLEAIDARK